MTQENHEIKMAMLVNRYATPLAILLVSMGIVLSSPPSPLREIAVGLLLFSVAFNLLTIRFIRSGNIPGLLGTRLTINLAVNVVLVYVLGRDWAPIWLLLPLTPMAMALYDSRRATLGASLAVSAALLIIQAARGPSAPVEWGQVVAYSAFTILISLLLNELAQLSFQR
jgi:hypothetical protein